MNQIVNLKKLNTLGYFDKNTLAQFINLSDNSLYANIKRWLKGGSLLQLKKGLYVTADYVATQGNRRTYTEFLANKLREPSYLTMDYVLERHNILSEAVFGFTSVTLKSGHIYKNRFGVFVYHNIREALFDGYEIRTEGEFQLCMATKAKALFDYLYYKLFSVRKVDEKRLESLRLNLDALSGEDKKEFVRYCERAGTKKMIALPERLWRLP